MRVLLVHLPPDSRETMFPLELSIVGAVLKGEGHAVDGFDFAARRGRTWPAVADSCEVVVWLATPPTWPRVGDLLRSRGPDQGRLTIVGGPYATLYPDEVLAAPAVDVVILGEPEQVIAEVVQSWQQKQTVPLPGVLWQQRWADRGFPSDRRPRRIERLGELPLPDLKAFRVDDYTGMATRRARYTQIVASRGSRRRDAQSPIDRLLPGPRRTRPVPHVIEEMAMLRERFGIEEFHFEDDALLEEPEYVVELCRAIRQHLPGVLWQCPNGNHPDDLRAELLEELASAGCYRIYLQLDSTNSDAMRLLGRPWDPAVIAPLSDAARRAGIELGGYFTLGLPGESQAQMQTTLRFAVDSGLTWAQFSLFRFNPGSELYDQREALQRQLPPGPRVRRIIRRAYWRFYARAGRWRVVLRNVNRRNGRQLLRRVRDKLVHGRT